MAASPASQTGKSAQDSLLIAEIKDGIVILKDGSIRGVILGSAINFDLMSQGEQEGVDYFFVSREKFEEMIGAGELIEYAIVYDDYKGVPRAQVDQALASGKDVIMRLDVQGAETIRKLYPEAVLIPIFALIQVQRKVWNRSDRQETEQQEADISNSAVGLTIEWNRDERLPLFEVPWRPGMTVRELMLDAQKAGKLTFEEAGEDDAAMLTAISGTKNEGGSTDSFNWTFRVNGTMGDKSFAIYKLQKGDIVSWKFGPYE